MKIGIDGSRAFVEQKTGTEFYSYEMVAALSRTKDIDVEFVVFIKPEQLSLVPEFLRKDSRFRFKVISWPRLWTQGGLALQTWMGLLDVLWVPAHTLPVLGNPFLPMVVTIHGIEYQYLPTAYNFLDNIRLTWSTKWAAFRSTKIVAVSEQTRKDLIVWLNIPINKVMVIHEGVDLKKYAVVNEKISQEVLKKFEIKKGNYVLFVGTVQPRKNLVGLIQAFSLLKRRKLVANSLQLVIVGKHGWDYREIIDAPRKHGVEESVKFLGYVEDGDLSILYSSAMVYVEPSFQEGFGLPILEAMASGVPVVAARKGALPEVAGNAAIYVEPTSIESIAAGILCLLSNNKLDLVPSENLDTGFMEARINGGESGFFVKDPTLLKMKMESRRGRLISVGTDQLKKFSWDRAAQQLMRLFQDVNR